MCYYGQDVAGTVIGSRTTITSTYECASTCIRTPGCTFSVFREASTSGYGYPTCHLKSSAFAGSQPSETTQRYAAVPNRGQQAAPDSGLSKSILFPFPTRNSSILIRSRCRDPTVTSSVPVAGTPLSPHPFPLQGPHRHRYLLPRNSISTGHL